MTSRRAELEEHAWTQGERLEEHLVHATRAVDERAIREGDVDEDRDSRADASSTAFDLLGRGVAQAAHVAYPIVADVDNDASAFRTNAQIEGNGDCAPPIRPSGTEVASA